jgi:hypothetical protein
VDWRFHLRHSNGITVTALTVQDGKLVLRDGKLGSGDGCCCGPTCGCTAPGFAPAIASNAARGLVWLEFSACIGSGVAGTVDAPEAASPCDYEGMAGPITGATVTNGGSGYARLGRVQPTVTASVSGGTGAAFSVTLAEQSENLGDGCMPAAYWNVASVSVTNGGSGYSDGVAVTFSAATGDTVAEAAKAYAYVAVGTPVATATVYGTGAGAVLLPTFAALTSPATSPSRGGAANPPFCTKPSRTAYEVTGFTISNGGSGYSVDDVVEIAFASNDDGIEADVGSFAVSSVDQSGAITAVTVNYGGEYGGSLTDELEEVVVEGCVGGAGKYYREDASVAPYVATVTVTVNQEEPSTGSGAVITATVEDDTASANFGKVVSLTVVDGGTGYLKTPAACEMPDKLYVQWGDATVEVPVRPVTYEPIWWLSYENLGSAWVCYDMPACEETPANWSNLGNTGSFAIGGFFIQNNPSQSTNPWGNHLLSCQCDGKLQAYAALRFQCAECVPGLNGPEIRYNYLSYRYFCLRFDTDENGCPVGDAEVLSVTPPTERVQPGDQGSPSSPARYPCASYTAPDGTFFDSDPCVCSDGCDTAPLPVVSVLPP